MSFLLNAIRQEKDFAPLLRAVKREKKPVLLSGVCEGARFLLPAALSGEVDVPLVVVFPRESEAAAAAAALSEVEEKTFFFPARDVDLTVVDVKSRDFSNLRLAALSALAAGNAKILTASYEALCQTTLPPDRFAAAARTLSVGDVCDPDALALSLVDMGYGRADRVDGAGQFARRGDILDLFAPGSPEPVRIEFFGDEIDAMGVFDPVTQRRRENVRRFTLSPAQELAFSREDLDKIRRALKKGAERVKDPAAAAFLEELTGRLDGGLSLPRDLFLPLCYPPASLLDYTENALFLLYEPENGKSTLEGSAALYREEAKHLAEAGKLVPDVAPLPLVDWDVLAGALSRRRAILAENFTAGHASIEPAGLFDLHSRDSALDFHDKETLFRELKELSSRRVVVLCESSPAAETALSLFADAGIPAAPLSPEEDAPAGVSVLARTFPEALLLRHGLEFATAGVAVITDGAGVPRKRKVRRTHREDSNRQKLRALTDLAPGDYVVHDAHGIGKFLGVEKLKGADGTRKDFLKIAYRGTDLLYVPCSNLDTVAKYVGPGSDRVDIKLNKLGGTEWHKAKMRAKAGAKDIAKDLIRLYAERRRLPGFAFSPDTPWQKEFEDAFPYGETEGQLQAAAEIKKDMESPVPMDRLLCGDVGFGKTEVALRGVFKCVMDNKQAAVLVPTTILAWQHYQTMLARFKGYPVKIEMLSRFRTPREQKKVLEGLANGSVDVVVGTHRLLQKDVRFRDLGYLVVDEEQRFGVTHKEKLKELGRGVDVLTLTATPIPRTLNMALGGIRDMSLLEEAPEDRFPVQTFVLPWDDALLTEAVARELRRGGQVFYLCNSIERLPARQLWLSRAFPEASVAVAHGQMDRDALSDVWKDMMDRNVDILCCTTIIETGVDLPDANTLIIEDADRFGLSQLHQIRGRVGRSDRKAYAYLTYRPGKTLSEVAVKRLSAIREYTEFGSGFSIALRDLELRGAGDLLGAQQSGHLDSVGYDLFLKLLEEAVLEEKGEKAPPEEDCTADLLLDAYLPEDYVPADPDRLELYRAIARVRTPEDADDLKDEMMDRFGELPPPAENLFTIALLRSAARALGCFKFRQERGQLVFLFRRDPTVEAALALTEAVYGGNLQVKATDTVGAYLRLREGSPPAAALCDEFFHHVSGFADELKRSAT